MSETLGSTSISTKLERIAMLARTTPGMPLTTLAHHIDVEWLHEAYRHTRKGGAVGIDGQSAEQYAVALALLEEGRLVLAVLGCPELPQRPGQPRDGARGCLFVASAGGSVSRIAFP